MNGASDSKPCAELLSHIGVPDSARDDAWRDQLARLVLDAPLQITPPDEMYGPDSNGYFRVFFPESEEYRAFQLRRDLGFLLDWTLGLVILNPNGNTYWVFSHGDILSFALYGTCNMRPWFDRPPGDHVITREMNVLCGSPNDDMLPLILRRSLDRYMREVLKVKVPKVGLVKFPDDPIGSLIFNLIPEDMGGADKADVAFRRLAWVIPRHMPFIRSDPMASAAFLQPILPTE